MLYRTVLVLFVSTTICLAARNYYQVLGVEREATTALIKRAFKKLALTHHPDKSDDPKASEKFMEITTAYETLFNEDKRKAYDRMGHEAYVQSKKQGGTPEEEAAFTNFFRQSTASSPDHEGYFESFDKFFSGGFGGPGQGGMYFRTDGAPMFQVDPQFLNMKSFGREFPEFVPVESNFRDCDTMNLECKPKDEGAGYYHINTDALMTDPLMDVAEMLFSEMRELRQDKLSEKYERLPNGGYYKVHTVHRTVHSSGHVPRTKSSTRPANQANKPILKKSRSHSSHSSTHMPPLHDSDSFNFFTSSRKATPEIKSSANKGSTANLKARSSTVRTKHSLPKISKRNESHDEQFLGVHWHYHFANLSTVCLSGMTIITEAILYTYHNLLAFFHLAFCTYIKLTFKFILSVVVALFTNNFWRLLRH